jgi:hypothetical protein
MGEGDGILGLVGDGGGHIIVPVGRESAGGGEGGRWWLGRVSATVQPHIQGPGVTSSSLLLIPDVHPQAGEERARGEETPDGEGQRRERAAAPVSYVRDQRR